MAFFIRPPADPNVSSFNWKEWFNSLWRWIDTHATLVQANKNGTDQTLTVNNTDTITFTNEVTDTHGWYDTATSKFTPEVPGYYKVTCQLEALSAAAWPSGGYAICNVRKNGSNVSGTYWISNGANSGSSIPVNVFVVYLNGSTDYVDISMTNAGTPTTPKCGGSTQRSWLIIEKVY